MNKFFKIITINVSNDKEDDIIYVRHVSTSINIL